MAEQKLIEQTKFLELYGPGYVEEDWWKEQYLCQWVHSTKRQVYKLSNKNLIGHLECGEEAPTAQFLQTATYGLGMDFGFSPDPMAFLTVAYNLKYSNKFYVIEEFKQTEMYDQDVSNKIKELDRKYHYTFMVADAGAQANQRVSNLNVNFGHFIVAADKPGKEAHWNMINSDFRSGNILISPNCSQLINEMQNLIFDPVQLNTNNKRVEKAGLPNDLCDSLLYIHHHCRHHWYKAPKPIVPVEQHFVSAILKGEKKFDKEDIIRRNKDRYNPYGKTYR